MCFTRGSKGSWEKDAWNKIVSAWSYSEWYRKVQRMLEISLRWTWIGKHIFFSTKSFKVNNFHIWQVLLDFKLFFENANDSGLVDKWPMIRDVPFKRFGIRIDKSEYPITRKDEDIFKMAMFLKLLPTPRSSFKKSLNSLIVHSEVSYM